MTKIVKSTLVVDENPWEKPPALPAELSSGAILKSRSRAGQTAPSGWGRMPEKDEYNDQLNRLRVDIRQAEEELRHLNSRLMEAKTSQVRGQKDAAQLWNVESEMAALVEQAKAEAEEITGQARADGVQLAEEARNNGYLDGFSRGYQEAGDDFKAEYGPKMAMLADILDRLSDYEAQVLQEQEENLVDLAIAIAKKVMGQTLEADPAAVAEMLRQTVEKNSEEQYVKVTLAPDLMPVQTKVAEKVRKLLSEMGANVTLIAEQALEPGSATVETPKGVVDVSIQTQLNNLKDAALGR